MHTVSTKLTRQSYKHAHRSPIVRGVGPRQGRVPSGTDSTTGHTPPAALPHNLRIRTAMAFHDEPGSGGHTGAQATELKVRQWYFWPTLSRDVADYVASCPQCAGRRPLRDANATAANAVDAAADATAAAADAAAALPPLPTGLPVLAVPAAVPEVSPLAAAVPVPAAAAVPEAKAFDASSCKGSFVAIKQLDANDNALFTQPDDAYCEPRAPHADPRLD